MCASISDTLLVDSYLSYYRVINDCPAGRYGRAERLSTSQCTGACAKGFYCPAGSIISTQYPCPIGSIV